ncbi:MAG: glycine cleavage system protein R [Betaproteobacteria bacterium]|nr:glycine cleavage system protein R [Betaproteobacteria bacterium]
MTTSLVVTAIGPDRPGIVNDLSDVAQRFGANWAGSRMANLAGQFAGMVHFEVSDEKADALAHALGDLESAGLRIVIARSQAGNATPPRRRVRLELVGHDRPGIIRDLSGSLAQRGVSIEELHTQVASAAMSGEQLFKVRALLAVPADLPNVELRRGLEALANEMMVDLELGEPADG